MYRPFEENVAYITKLIRTADSDPKAANKLESIIGLYCEAIRDNYRKENALDEAIELQYDLKR